MRYRETKSISEIAEMLQQNIKDISKMHGSMDGASWMAQDGILISGNEAQSIVDALTKIKEFQEKTRLRATVGLNDFSTDYELGKNAIIFEIHTELTELFKPKLDGKQQNSNLP